MVAGDLTGRSTITCPRCKATISWPSPITPEAKQKIATEVRTIGLMAVHGMRAREGMGVAEAKALLFHITRVKGQCHRYGRDLGADVTICQHCRSANLDW